jgi:hypothetical protein
MSEIEVLDLKLPLRLEQQYNDERAQAEHRWMMPDSLPAHEPLGDEIFGLLP